MINNGLMEVGTEDDPYCSKLTITMYGSKYDPAMPIYGKKVIGIRYSTLDMHGCPVSPCWTRLGATATSGTNTITTAELTDWKVGDVILLPSTSYSMSDAELHTIAAITHGSDYSTITTVDDLESTHYGEIEEYGSGEFIDLRGEIALMSRSIVYRGDPETSATKKFGAHIMVHSPGDETSIGRIENVQLEDVGQAFLLGKYPIHFHMIGRVTQSYVRCNTVNRSYNRGTTIHGV
jgi:cell migration-inducing and hyaluronan-binding protein